MRWYYLLRVSPGLPKAPEAIDCVGCLKHKFEPAYIARRDRTSEKRAMYHGLGHHISKSPVEQ